jgi:hypothetical protein
MDPDAREERLQDGNIVVALMPVRNEVTQMHVAGSWGEPQAAQVSGSADFGLWINDCLSALSARRRLDAPVNWGRRSAGEQARCRCSTADQVCRT